MGKDEIAAKFSDLRAAAQVVVALNVRSVWRTGSAVSKEASAANSTLIWLAAISVSTSAALMAALLALIHRPFRQLDNAIRSARFGPPGYPDRSARWFE